MGNYFLCFFGSFLKLFIQISEIRMNKKTLLISSARNIDPGLLKKYAEYNLLIYGVNTIFSLIPTYFEYIDLVIVPENFKSNKVNKLLERCNEFGINFIRKSSFIDYINKVFLNGISRVNSVALLKKSIQKIYSINYMVDKCKRQDKFLALAFDNIDYPNNIGAILRTAYALGVDFVIFSNRQKGIFSPAVNKISMGYNLLVSLVQDNFGLVLKTLADNGVELVAFDCNGENISEVVYNSQTCFVFGSEGEGLSENVLKKVSRVVKIPMYNYAESLNLSVAVGIAVYDRIIKLNYEFKRKI